MSRDDYLFQSSDSHSVQERQRAAMVEAVRTLDSNRLLNSNVDDLIAHFVANYSIEVPTVRKDLMRADQGEVQIDVARDRDRFISDRSRPFHVAGTRITVWLPFEGDPNMFRIRPSTWDTMPPRAVIEGNTLVLRHDSTQPSPERVRQDIDQWTGSIEQYLEWLRNSFSGFNETLAAAAKHTIEARREKLLADQNVLAGIGIPMRERPDAPKTYTAPEVRRKIAPQLPAATPGRYQPEPVIGMDVYDHILSIMQSMVTVMERSPRAFHELDEEGIRTHFLVQLNGQYQGAATGETFNYEGKTDILVRSGDRNVFVAECKFWGGPARFTETIDQLLGYLTWRDGKAAIVIFNRNKDFSRVLSAIPGTVKAHPNFRKELPQPGETSFRYIFRHKDDAAKDLIVTVMAFDIPRDE